ncbi:Abhydrolase family protein [Anatilimnocola aggregata]|uniref:Abhydrolase family protein n=1 Tax=Anatilimnocola aggregata TaxID=2528021 RepID=A0A517YDA5_9BACT|nr:alpha/beta hydrolase family protein [Anatilimnocola aggregata]QDU28217.1 Abhydrolase family protein [Anatilimnocola aggregata]
MNAVRSLIAALVTLSVLVSAVAQERVVPQSAKGGKEQQGEAWAEVPELFKAIKLPGWQVPQDLKRWEETDRAQTKATLVECLGEMPKRPDPKQVKVISREDKGTFWLEKFEFHNGADMVVTGILAIPKNIKEPAPVVVGMHGHSGSKGEYIPNPENELSLGWMLVQKGFVVAAIDGYFNGERVGKGPGGAKLDAGAYPQELSLFKLHLWQGRCLWGMMIRDEQCLLDYLETRPEVDKSRIGVTGMSMGCTRAWWVSAVDDRVQAQVGVACFTRYTELIAHGNLRRHGIYYFVPGVFQHFDTEAIFALSAPKPNLQLSGDEDGGAPTDGVIVLEKKLGEIYKLYGKPENFRSVLYAKTGHEYLPEMRVEMVAWFTKHLKP